MSDKNESDRDAAKALIGELSKMFGAVLGDAEGEKELAKETKQAAPKTLKPRKQSYPESLRTLAEKAVSENEGTRIATLKEFSLAAAEDDWPLLADVITQYPKSLLDAGTAGAPVDVLEAIFMSLTNNKPEGFGGFLVATIADVLMEEDDDEEDDEDETVYLLRRQVIQQLIASEPTSEYHQQRMTLLNDILKHTWGLLNGEEIREYYLSPQELYGAISLDNKKLIEVIKDYIQVSVTHGWIWRTRSGVSYTKDEVEWLAKIFKRLAEADSDWLAKMNGRGVLRSAHLREEDEVVKALEAELPELLKNKELRERAESRLALSHPRILEGAGLLNHKRKKVKQMAIGILLESVFPEAAQYLSIILEDKSISAGDRALVSRKIKEWESLEDDAETSSEAAEEASSPLDLGQLRTMASNDKAKVSKYIDRLWEPQYETLLKPLDKPLIRWVLNLAHEVKDELLDPVVQAFNLVDPEARAEFIVRLLNKWAKEKLHARMRWVLLIARQFPSSETSEALGSIATAQAWDRRESTLAIVETLGSASDGTALSYLDRIASGNFPAQHRRMAKGLLVSAAQSHQISLGELLEQALPGGEMGIDGEVLSLGSRSVTLRLTPALELQIIPEQGKAAKSIPRIRKEDNPVLHKAAKARVDTIKRQLKSMGVRLQQRLQSMFFCGRQWRFDKWQSWLASNPLLATAAQQVIWARLDNTGTLIGTFRIGEDRSLTGVEDNTVNPAPAESISVWHPLMGESEKIESWRTHFTDYELVPMLPQLEKPSEIANSAFNAEGDYVDLMNKTVTTKSFKAWKKTTGFYNERGDSDTTAHFLLLPYLNKAIVLQHESYGYFEEFGYEEDDEVTLAEAYCIDLDLDYMAAGKGTNGKKSEWSELPEVTQAIVLKQLESLGQLAGLEG